jgi:putative flippase GtrA
VKRLLLFGFAGGVGFVADAGMLALVLAITPLGPLVGRVIAIGFAMTVTWIFNRTLTFGKSQHSLASEGARYSGVGIAAALINYAIYAGLLALFPKLYPVLAVAAASLAAMAFSWAGYSRFVFGR